MRKLISFLMAVLIALPLYSKDPEYVSVGKQFNTVVVNVPASITIEKSQDYSIEVTNDSYKSYVYEFKNDTLVIKNKFISSVDMEPEYLQITLKHPTPSKLYKNIRTNKRGLNLIKRRGDQK